MSGANSAANTARFALFAILIIEIHGAGALFRLGLAWTMDGQALGEANNKANMPACLDIIDRFFLAPRSVCIPSGSVSI